jgi:hypothetical protein
VDRRKSTIFLVARLCGASTVRIVISRFISAELRSHGIRVSGMGTPELQWTPGCNASDVYKGWHTVRTDDTDLSRIHLAFVPVVLVFADLSIRVRREGASRAAIFAACCIAIFGLDSTTVTTVFDECFSTMCTTFEKPSVGQRVTSFAQECCHH